MDQGARWEVTWPRVRVCFWKVSNDELGGGGLCGGALLSAGCDAGSVAVYSELYLCFSGLYNPHVAGAVLL